MVRHVLLIDADSSAAHITSAIVQRLAPDVTVACERTPERGWFSAQHQQPDVLIIDPSPHGPAGTLLIEICKATWPETRVVVLSSAPTPALRTQIQQLAVDAYLEKPAPPTVLIEHLLKILGTNKFSPQIKEIPSPAPA